MICKFEEVWTDAVQGEGRRSELGRWRGVVKSKWTSERRNGVPVYKRRKRRSLQVETPSVQDGL